MLNLSDYQITAELYTSLKRIVYRGIRLSDQQPVILKCFSTTYPTPTEIARLKYEYEITKHLNLSGIIKPLTLLTDPHNPILILEDIGGLSLKKYLNQNPLELGAFLQIAIQLAQTLGELHQQGIIHKDIKPSNIILNPETFEVKLTDFAIASQLTKETPTLSHPNLLEGSLAYMSPEQTGRMNRSIDYRTDFYSLGVTFYEMLTGKLPYDSDDSMELVHCHIARIPVPPNQANPQIPQVVSNIIMKLVAKTAEERYQSGFGLKTDLEKCLNQWQDKGEILEFTLASQDFSGQLRIPQKLYGRERELAQLLVAFERVCDGKTELMLIAGYSGIGKSALVQEIQKPLVRYRGYFISGKFDQYKRNIPYSSLIQAFSELMRQLLTESEQQIQSWKEKLLTALGSNGQVIIDVIPELELIIGKQPPVPELGATENQNRFNLFLKKFIHVFTQKEHPLVLFLDDLQWSDLASLKLIQLLMTEPDSKYLLLIGAYRDNEVDATHPLMMTLDEIQKSGALVNQITLRPLELTHINQLISETLNCVEPRLLEEVGVLGYPKSKPLAELVLIKTNGNPFFLTQLLKSLHQENLFNFDFNQGVWQWDIERLQAVGITDNVVDLMISQIQKLSEETQNILKLAACIGNRFNLEVLAVVYEKSIPDTATQLWEAVQAGLILPETNLGTIPVAENESGETLYKFLHDRVQQAAYSLIPDSQKKAVHLKIGQLLLKNTPPDKREEKIFDIVNHLNFSTSLIIEQSERDELAGLNLIAGKKAKLSVAYQPALNYLQIGIELLAINSWEQRYNLTLSLYEEAAEVAYLNADFALTERLTEAVLLGAKTVLDKVKVYEVKILTYIAQGKYSEAINIGLELLDLLGVKLPKQPSKLDVLRGLLRTKLIIGHQSIASLVDLPVMTASYPKAAMRILNKISTATYFTAPLLMPLIVFRQVNLSLKWGNDTESAVAYSYYGLLLCGMVGDIKTGCQFGQLALNLVSQFNAREIQAKTGVIVHSFIGLWIEPVKEILKSLREVYAVGLETGDLEFAAYSAHQYCYHAYLSGSELTQLESELATYTFFTRQMGQEASADLQEMFHQVLLNFIDTAEDPCYLTGKVFDERMMLPILQSRSDRTGICLLYFHKLVLYFLFGEYALAVNTAESVKHYVDSISGHFVAPNFYFYDSLARLAVATDAELSGRKNHLQKVLGNQKKMKKWAHHAPMNFQHKYDLVAAEYYRVCSKHYQAIDYYDRAIEGAAKNGYIHEEALANELAAKFYLSLGKNKIAKTYMTEAYSGYIRWGAIAKVKYLESRYPDLIPRQVGATSPNNETITESTLSRSNSHTNLLDLTTVLKASQAIASEIDLDNLLAKLMKIVLENAGAQSGILLLNREGKLFVEAAGTIGTDQILVRRSIPVESSDIPLSMINYVARTQEDVVLNEASEQGKFINDPYIIANQPKSVLCTPILSKGKLIGILYIENNLIAGTFTPERTQLLKLLCSQAAISLENAQLYEAQKEYAKTLERQVQERTQELQQQKAWFDGFFAASTAGFAILNKELRYVQANEAIAEFTTLSAADHIGKTLWEVIPHLAPVVEPTFQQVLTTGEALLNLEVSGETLSQPGIERHWIVSYFPLPGLDGKPIGAGTVVMEISDRKRAEEALRQSEERWQLAVHGTNDGIWDWNIKTNEVFISPRYKEMLGYKDSEMAGSYEEWATRVHPDDLEAVIQTFQNHLDGKTEYYITEHRLRCKDGTYKWILARGRSLRDETGKAIRATGSHTDISDRKRAEQALQEQEVFLRSIYDGVDQAIFVVDIGSDGEYDFAGWNRVAEAVGGVSSRDALGKTPEEVFGAVIGATIRQHYNNCLMAGTAITYEEYFVSEGVQTWTLTTLNPLRDAAGNIHRIIGTATNISDRKRAEEALRQSEERWQLAIQGNKDGIWDFNPKTKELFMSPRCMEMLGFEDHEKAYYLDDWLQRIHPDDLSTVWDAVQNNMNGKTPYYTAEYRVLCEDGTYKWIQGRGKTVWDEQGNPLRMAGSVTDISDRKRAEAALQQAKETADAASRAKGEFLSKMSHELRTPLNAILGFSQILNRDSSLTSQQQEYLGIINRAGEHLLTLINDVLEMSKIEAGRIELRENTFNLYRLLDSLEEMFQFKAESQGLQLTFNMAQDVPQYIKTDESKLRQVLINLLGNAIKFTETGSVTLRVKVVENVDATSPALPLSPSPSLLPISRLLFEVEDTGPGIAPEELTTLFDPFVQTETGKKSQSGTGLGLPISRQFVQLMGGEITVSSTLNQGSIFQFDIRFSLPEAIDIPTGTATQKAIALEPNQPAYRLLVVEDKPESRLLLVNLLSQVGFEVREAVNGQEAITVAESWQPHLIWMDIQMPVMDGYEATRQIRARETQNSGEYLVPTTPTIIIALTANAFAEDKAAVLSAGCDDFVSKPFRQEVIFEKIAHYLGVRYVYEQTDLPSAEKPKAEATSVDLTPESLQGISPEYKAQLYQAAIALDDELMRQLCEQIGDSHPQFVKTLLEFTKKLRFDKIIEVLEQMPNDERSHYLKPEIPNRTLVSLSFNPIYQLLSLKTVLHPQA